MDHPVHWHYAIFVAEDKFGEMCVCVCFVRTQCTSIKHSGNNNMDATINY